MFYLTMSLKLKHGFMLCHYYCNFRYNTDLFYMYFFVYMLKFLIYTQDLYFNNDKNLPNIFMPLAYPIPFVFCTTPFP